MNIIDVDVYDIDGKSYIELKKIEINQNTYLVLSMESDENNVLVQLLDNNELVDVDNDTKSTVLSKFIEIAKK